MNDVQQEVIDIIARETDLAVARITPDATLKDLEIDSLSLMEIVFEIEEHFGITLPEREGRFEVGTVRALVDLIEHEIAAAGQAPAG
jgi:acyl carrier protein